MCINADNKSIVSGLVSSDICIIVNCIFKASKIMFLRYLNVYLKTAIPKVGGTASSTGVMERSIGAVRKKVVVSGWLEKWRWEEQQDGTRIK